MKINFPIIVILSSFSILTLGSTLKNKSVLETDHNFILLLQDGYFSRFLKTISLDVKNLKGVYEYKIRRI